MNRAFNIIFGIGIGIIALGILAPMLLRQAAPKSTLPELYSAPNFALTDATGSEFSSSALSDKVWVANFFFTSCRGPCPIQTANLAKVANRFDKEPNLHFVSISVDPERDTTEALAAYAERFNADTSRWHFLRAEDEELDYLLNEGFKLGSADQRINHSTRFVLVDSKGTIRSYYVGTDAEDVEKLISEIPALLQR